MKKAEKRPQSEKNLRPIKAAEQKAGKNVTKKLLDERLLFEQLLSNLSAMFVNIPPERVDQAIRESLKQILDFFKVDRCGLIQILPGKGMWQITHVAFSNDVPPVPVGAELTVTKTNPWAYKKLIEDREVLNISNLDDLPPEANVDKQTWNGWGIRSTLTIPTLASESVVHVISLNSVKSERVWPEDLVQRLRLMGEIFVNALVRNQMMLEIEKRHRFERLISYLSARFVNLEPDQIGDEIERSQRRICELLDLDRSALFQLKGEPGVMVVTCYYQSKGSPAVAKGANVTDQFPWGVRKLLSGERVTVGNLADLPSEAARDRESWRLYGTKSTVVVPLSVGGGPVFGALTFAATREERDWTEPIVEGFQLIAQVFANALERKHADEQIKRYVVEIENLKQRLEKENIYLQEEVKLLADQTEIVGQSLAMKNVLSQAKQVAPTDSSVLIQGETGTGKELLARAIHSLSSRKDRPLVTVNCASLPPTLIESELFGRERGAYTGALTKMIGRFEIADGSTIFLDEIGEIPLEVQSKLLRVIEAGNFDRLGSTKTLHVDVRIISATNRDLGEEVKAGRFRKDLYYRLNVFPITIPPLRERREDIPPLVRAFVMNLKKKMGKEINIISKRTMDALQSYSWPGNARELRNVIEHAMILSKDNTLVVSLPNSGLPEAAVTQNLHDMERMHMVSVLEETGWRVSGKGGAAETLGLKRTTLDSKMKKLGIKRPNK